MLMKVQYLLDLVFRLICVSKAMLSWLCKRQLRHTLLGSSKTLTFVPSMPSVSPSCPRISSWLGGSGVNVHKGACCKGKNTSF